MDTWSLTLLGGFGLRLTDGVAVDLPGQKDRALLAALAMGSGDAQSRERLAGLLWSEHGDRQARDSLKQALVRLRRCLGGGESVALRTDRQSIALDKSLIEVDVLVFEQLVQQGTLASLTQAMEIYRGDLLEGIAIRDPAFEDWLLVERQRLCQLFERALAGLMSQALAVGDRERAAGAARRLLQVDPLSEVACRALMQVHADEGQTAQAIKLYKAFRDRLYREMGVQPEPETKALCDRIRERRAAAAASASAEPTPDAPASDCEEPAGVRGFPTERLRVPPAASDGGDGNASPAAAALPRTPTTGKCAIAVLPFTNMSGDPDQEYFADGLTEDTIAELSQVSGLSVVARHTAFTFKGRTLHLQQVARELNVDYLLEGSVRKVEGCLRVNAQLIDGATGDHRWSRRYDRRVEDVFALQDEISRSIVDVLKVTLLPGELETLTRHPTANTQAYEYYLMGRSFYLRGMDKRCLGIARDMYAKAAELDPDYARAYAGLAICESYVAASGADGSFESALANSARALALEPDLAEAYAAKGLALYAAVRFDEAAVEFERATALDPGLFEAHFFLGRNCRNQGRRAEAAALFARAAELRPNDFRSPGLLAWECKALGRREEFAVALWRCLPRVEAEIKAHPDNADALAFGSSILVAMGDPARAEDWASRAVMLGADDYVVQYNVALTNALLGKIDPALDRLERAFSAAPAFRRRLTAWLEYDGEMDVLRDHPRFQSLMDGLDGGVPVAADGAEGDAAEPLPRGPAGRKPSIAVLPFTNMSGDPDQEYFADGLTEDIITDLSQVSALSVVARHTAFPFKGKALQVQQVARDLKVDYVLEGSVRKSDGQVRVTAQLIDGATGDHRWAHRYDRRFDDIFALQDEISKSIVDVLRVTLLPAELETITRHPTADARAYEYYLMGRSFYLRGQGKRHLAMARDMYAKAAEIDPDYARAYAGMAICDSYEATRHPDGSFETALANSERALALDANLAEAYAAKGFALFAAVRFDEAAVEFERATRLDPGLFEAHFFHARNCHNLGLRAEAAALFARAAELRPGDFRSPGLLAWECKALGRREQSAAALRRCLARLEAEVKAHPDNADALVFGSSILVESGDSARAEDWLARAIILGPDDRFVHYNAALTNAMLGRTDAALDHLEQAFSAPPTFRRRLAAWMKYDDEMDVLRDHPRFRALMDSLDSGMPAAPVVAAAANRDAEQATKPSVAVLPFVDLSGDPEQQYFSDGVTEDIITELSRFRTLFVVARNSSFRYRGGNLDLIKVGRELGVRYLCEGSVRRTDDRLRINAQLIEAATGAHLWAEKFDRDARDILAVQDDIVHAIATTLGYRVEAAGRERALRLSPEALSAYDLTLRCEALLLRHTKEDNAEARRLSQQAIDLDPKSAPAHAQLGWTYCLDQIFGWTEESGDPLGEALALAQRAVLLDEADCRARWLLGYVHTFRREYDEACAHLRRAIELNPNDVEARATYGLYLNMIGEVDAALEQFDIAKQRNPFEFNWIILCTGSTLFTARRYGAAVAVLKRVHNPNNEVRLWLAASLAAAGCLPEARATLAGFLTAAEREMARFPGRALADWRPQLHRFVEYRDPQEFDHLCGALQAAGLR